MAIADQVFEYFMPVVNLMGPGAVKEVGSQAVSLGGGSSHDCAKDIGLVAWKWW